MPSIDAQAVLHDADLPEIVRIHVPDLRRNGREWIGRCPFHNERTASFTIFEKAGGQRYHCFGCGADGDAIGFIMKAEGLEFRDALEHLADLDPSLAPRRPRAPPFDDAKERAARIAAAKRIWSAAKPWNALCPSETPLEAYLRARGIDIEAIGGVPPSIRFDPALLHPPTRLRLPAMVAAIQEPNGKVAGVHRTYLKADGSAKAEVNDQKMMKGICWTGAVRFGPVTPILALAEGIETALSIVQAFAEEDIRYSVWAALSLGNIGSAVIPGSVRRLMLFADNAVDTDKAKAAIDKAAWLQERPDRFVVIAMPPPGQDFNDVLRAASD